MKWGSTPHRCMEELLKTCIFSSVPGSKYVQPRSVGSSLDSSPTCSPQLLLARRQTGDESSSSQRYRHRVAYGTPVVLMVWKLYCGRGAGFVTSLKPNSAYKSRYCIYEISALLVYGTHVSRMAAIEYPQIFQTNQGSTPLLCMIQYPVVFVARLRERPVLIFPHSVLFAHLGGKDAKQSRLSKRTPCFRFRARPAQKLD
jgi:hypothetical protein